MMLGGFDQNTINQWKESLHQYEKNKRTKKPFGKDSSIYDTKIVHSSEIKENQRKFNPVLQKYKQESLEKKTEKIEEARNNLRLANYLKNVKSNSDYDIVSLHSLKQEQINPQKEYNQWSKNKNKNNPIRNLYNVINNQSIPSSYLQNRNVKVDERQTSRKIYSQKLRQSEFDFVKGRYLENNDDKLESQRQQENSRIKQKLNKSYQFDNIFQRYYNPQKQEKYQSQMYKSQLVHGKDYLQKLPPSYRNREPLTFNYFQEKSSPALTKIFQKQQNSLKKNQLRYVIEQQYKKRNEEEFQKRQRILSNKVHEGKIFQDMVKQYNIISNKLQQLDQSQLYQKKISKNPYSYDFLKSGNVSQNGMIIRDHKASNNFQDKWEINSQSRSVRSNSSFDSKRYSIKSGGFS